ncbi:XRE family transcriptional regulator [Saccharopolyspora sp. HNM0986]|uniref:XRE family transcriptional regulator n=1 Tax=Saccharopolyspora galaxeae TaxID=2781241 RepID=UPI00190A7079|nr:XRE family transcriptional regulator [Saccharopolyspora sp. HNM0986]MBK0869289.1 XRE family transcriptional regulator [Saccharopolyspora sp. HNM0986]
MNRAADPAEQLPKTLADKLGYLIDIHVRQADQRGDGSGRWPTFEKLAAEISEATGKSISHGYLHQLCRGHRDNPTLHHLQGLAEFFRVPVAFFTDDESTREIIAQYELVLAMRSSRIREICTYAPLLDGEGLDEVTALVKSLAIGRQSSAEPRSPQG